jgi:putative N6-adenine-specific DNA methylase
MTKTKDFEIFLATAPGLEPMLYAEVRSHRFKAVKEVAGGVAIHGTWPDVWRANLVLRGPSRILARIDAFRAPQLADFEKRARRVPWRTVLRPDVPVRVEATCKASRIYHSGAAEERIAKAITAEIGAPISDEASVCIRARIENDFCTISVDTSGELLHKRGHKEAVAKAPMRENMAALFLRQAGYVGTEPVVDPMCGSGTFVIEAAEIAAGLKPGRSRHFAFEELATFDAAAWQQVRGTDTPIQTDLRFYGSDRDQGAITMSRANAERAGVAAITEFQAHTLSELQAPSGPTGLVIVNPPYGTRIGEKRELTPLYRSLGQTLMTRFSGWRAAIIATDATLARATGLPFAAPAAPVAHGGLRVTLFQTGPLA